MAKWEIIEDNKFKKQTGGKAATTRAVTTKNSKNNPIMLSEVTVVEPKTVTKNKPVIQKPNITPYYIAEQDATYRYQPIIDKLKAQGVQVNINTLPDIVRTNKPAVYERKKTSGDELTKVLKREILATVPYFSDTEKYLEKGLSSITPNYKSEKDREILFNRYRPVAYPSISSAVGDVFKDYKNNIFNTPNTPPLKDKEGDLDVSEEAWRMGLGLPVKNKYILPSKYRPLNEKDKTSKYYTLNENIYDKDLLRQKIKELKLKPGQSTYLKSFAPFVNENYMNQESFSDIDPLQNFKIGVNENGKMYFYDKYDFDFDPLTKVTKPYEYEFYNEFKNGGVIEDPMGQWAHPGSVTRIPSNQITMQGVNYPVLGISDRGHTQIMYPGEDYSFRGKSVTEYPMMQSGGQTSLRNQILNTRLPATNRPTLNLNFNRSTSTTSPLSLQALGEQDYGVSLNKNGLNLSAGLNLGRFSGGLNYGYNQEGDKAHNFGANANLGLGKNLNLSADTNFDSNKNYQVNASLKYNFQDGGEVNFTYAGENHRVYKKESPTGNGKGIEGHIMVNHPTENKGKWDTIDLTKITNGKVKTVAQGVASTKKWHDKNPEYATGGNVSNWEILEDTNKDYEYKNGGKTPAWQRKEGKSPTGGLNAKGRASLKKEGHNIKPPQPQGGSRKKSFCARMTGLKKKLTGSKKANDPNSRVNLSLKKWKC